MALVLLLDYLTKRPSELSRALYLLSERFGFEHDSYAYKFVRQRTVIDVLWERTQEDENEIFSKLFLAVAKKYLQTHFNTTKLKGRRTIDSINFELPPTPELIELRQRIWKQVFLLYQTTLFREEVLNLLHNYSRSGYKVSVGEIIAQDATEVLPFIESALDSSSYYHCLVVQDYLAHLEHHKVLFSKELCDHFTNETYALSQVLLFNRAERRSLDLEDEKYKQFKRQQIEEYFATYNFTDYKQFFEICLEIQGESDRRNDNKIYLSSRVLEVLIALAHRNSELYIEVLKYYLNFGEPLKLDGLHLVDKILPILGVEKSYDFLNESDYPSKRKWLFYLHRLLPQEAVKIQHLQQLYELYSNSEPGEIPHELNFLMKYHSLDAKVVVRVVEIILEKIHTNLSYSHVLSTFSITIQNTSTFLKTTSTC
jgi:hypothetical protein